MPTKPLADVILTSPNFPGQNITVSTTIESTNPLVFAITAVIPTFIGPDGQPVKFTERHAIGADGAGPLLSAVGLSASLTGYRQAVADKCAWAAHADTLAGGLT